MGSSISEIVYPDNVFAGEQGHPQCPFFEAFPSSADPYETFYGELYCHMSGTLSDADECKGDYINCPLAYGKCLVIRNE